MSTTTMPPQVAKQLRRPPQVATRSRAWRILAVLAALFGGTIALGYLLFRTASPGVKEAMVHQATSLMGSATQDGYSTPVKAEAKAPTLPVDISAEERRKILELLAAMQKRIEDLEKRKTQPVTTQAAATKPPEKRPAPMLYLNKELQDTTQSVSKGSEYTIMPGDFVPCVIETAMNSDTGDVTFTAVVTSVVYDSDSHRLPLVMQGSKIVGEAQGSQLVYGNELMRTVGLTLSRPGDTQPIDLGHAPLTNQIGINGLASHVNSHFWRNVSAVFIGGALKGGTQALQTSIATAGGVGQVTAGISSMGGQVVQQQTSRALDTRPTIDVYAGQPCTVIITKPLRLTLAHP